MRFKNSTFFVLLIVCVLPWAGPGAVELSGSDRFPLPDDQLRGLLETMLAENPDLASAAAMSRSLSQRSAQQQSLPDLSLAYRYFAKTPETRVGPQEHMVEVSQAIPWGSKRKLQGKHAELLTAEFDWQIADLERRLVADLKRAYFESAYLQEALQVNREESELLRRFEAIALKRYATGKGIQQNAIKIQTEISRLLERETYLRQRLDSVTRRIARLIGHPETRLSLEPIVLHLPDDPVRVSAPEELVVTDHPRVRSVTERIEAERVLQERRELESRPDFRLGLGYTFVGRREDQAGTINPPADNGQDVLALSVGMKIPIYRKRIRAGVAEAREAERAGAQKLRAVRDGLSYDIQDARLRVDSMIERGGLYAEVIIPQAEESLASAEAAYATDELSFLDLLDAQRVLFQSRLAHKRIVADCWIALADLEEAVPPVQAGNGEAPTSKTGSMQ